jgi:protein TonB
MAAVLVVACVLAGCKKDQADAGPAPEEAATAAEGAATPAVAGKVTAMSADDLREAAGKALREQRLYAPAGDNAMEYYLALRDKQPNDPAVSSALTDLQPYALIATEQSIGRDDFEEAERLYALLAKSAPTHPALARLEKAIADGRTEFAAGQQREALQAEEEAKRKAELERQRLADQQKAQQEATRKLEADREEAARAAAAKPAAPPPTPQRQAATQPAAQPQQQAAPPPAPKVANTLRPVSLPNPRYPREAALRRRSGSVEVEFTVGTDGRVTSSRVVHASPPRVFDRAALAAVDDWRFEPIGAPITTRRTINFQPTD